MADFHIDDFNAALERLKATRHLFQAQFDPPENQDVEAGKWVVRNLKDAVWGSDPVISY